MSSNRPLRQTTGRPIVPLPSAAVLRPSAALFRARRTHHPSPASSANSWKVRQASCGRSIGARRTYRDERITLSTPCVVVAGGGRRQRQQQPGNLRRGSVDNCINLASRCVNCCQSGKSPVRRIALTREIILISRSTDRLPRKPLSRRRTAGLRHSAPVDGVASADDRRSTGGL